MSEEMRISQALNRAIADAMAEDDTVILLGEDIAQWLSIPPSEVVVVKEKADGTLPDVVVTIGKDFTVPGG